jgi:hypothetical protein
LLNNLNNRKATGTDGISNKLYKSASLYLAAPLTNIINTCISSNSVPSLFKAADVCAIPKVTSPSLDQLRPISLLSVPNQLLEHHVLSHTKSSLYPCIDNSQYAYVPTGSATCALLNIQHHIVDILDDKKYKGCIILSFDFSKAFDCVDHTTLVNKLLSCNLPTQFVSWIKSYLTNRTQRVRIGNTVSSYLPCTSGVPQGSKVGPLLFDLYTSEIRPFHSSTHHSKYADDTELILPVPLNMDFDDLSIIINDEIENMKLVSSSINLKLNVDKTKLLPILKRGYDRDIFSNHILYCDSLRLLGVFFNNNLNWQDHFNNRIKQCSRRVFALKIIKRLLPRKNLIMIYQSLVLSVLEYANPLFLCLPKNIQQKIDALQKRCHFIIDGPNCNCTDFPNLENRRTSQSMRLFNSIIASNNKHVLSSIMPSSTNSSRLFIPSCNTSRKLNCFVTFCSALHNNTFKR